MSKNFNSPAEVIEMCMDNCEKKVRLPLLEMILMGILAGAFVAVGAATSGTAVHDIANVGLGRMLSGVIFPVGLMMIVFLGGELVTGNCLIFLDVLGKRVTVKECVRDLVIIYFSNMVGAVFVATLIYFSGNMDYSKGLLGAYAIRVAVGKVTISPFTGITSGILCNMLVCVAVLIATAANDIAGKIWGIFFPIFAFVVGGFEHCVANMFYIPVGMMAARNPAYGAKAQLAYGLTAEEIGSLTIMNALKNLIPVTIGNIIGGMICIALPCYLIYKKNWQQTK